MLTEKVIPIKHFELTMRKVLDRLKKSLLMLPTWVYVNSTVFKEKFVPVKTGICCKPKTWNTKGDKCYKNKYSWINIHNKTCNPIR